MSSIIPQKLRNRCDQSSDSPDAEFQKTLVQPNFQQQTVNKPELQAAPARRRLRKTNPAVSSGVRPRADVSLSRISTTTSREGQIIEIPLGTIPDIGYSSVQPPAPISTVSVSVPGHYCESNPGESDFTANNQPVHYSPITLAQNFFVRVPNSHLYANNAGFEPVHQVFPCTAIQPINLIRDYSAFEVVLTPNHPNQTILATEYNPNGASVSSENEGKKYVLKQSTVIFIHPILQLRDSRDFVAAIPIPRTGDEEADLQYLKRIVIARDTGVESHVNIRVQEISSAITEEDRNSLLVLDQKKKNIGRLANFTYVPGSPQQLYISSENHGSVTQHGHPVDKLASSHPTLANRSRNVGNEFVGSPSQFNNPANNVTRKRGSKKTSAKECITLYSSDEECEPSEKKSVPIGGLANPIVNTTPVSASDNMSLPLVNGIFSPTGIASIIGTHKVRSPNSPSKVSQARNIIMMSNTPDNPTANKDATPDTPETVTKCIEELRSGVRDAQGSCATLECRSIRIGSYKVAPAENLSDVKQAFVSSLGILLHLPHCVTGVTVKICIPFHTILSVHSCFKKLYCLYISTGPKHATWIRQQLGMGNDTDSEFYFCPLEGRMHHKLIVLLMDRSLKDLERGILIRIFGNTLTELNYEEAHKMLVEINTYDKKQQPIAVAPVIQPTPPPVSSMKAIEPPVQTKQIEQPSPKKIEVAKTKEETVPVSSQTPAALSQNETTISTSGSRLVSGGDWGIELLDHDLASLRDEQFLNDNIIDFWLKYTKKYYLNDEDKARTYIFSTFFYSKLTTKSKGDSTKLSVAERRHARVAKWTKHEDIFKYDFLIVPILENAHWFLAIICFPSLDGIYDCDTGELIEELKARKVKDNSKAKGKGNTRPSSNKDGNDFSCESSPAESSSQKHSSQNTVPNLDIAKSRKSVKRSVGGVSSTPNIKQPCILIFDSLAGDMRNKVYSTLREYLRVEYKTKKGVEKDFSCHSMPGSMPKVPQQPNYCDCGIYLLQYVESFFSDPIKSFKANCIDELKTWFKSSVIQKKRKHIYDSVVLLVKKEGSFINIASIPEITFNTEYQYGTDEDDSKNMKIVKATEDEDVDVGNENEACNTVAKCSSPPPVPTPNVLAAVLDHDYIAAPKIEMVSTSVVSAIVSTTASSAVATNTVTVQSQTSVACEPSKISLTVPSLSIKNTAAVSTNSNSAVVTSNPVPAKRVPCYANANAPVKKSTVERVFKCNQIPEKCLPLIHKGTNHIISIPGKLTPGVVCSSFPGKSISGSTSNTIYINPTTGDSPKARSTIKENPSHINSTPIVKENPNYIKTSFPDNESSNPVVSFPGKSSPAVNQSSNPVVNFPGQSSTAVGESANPVIRFQIPKYQRTPTTSSKDLVLPDSPNRIENSSPSTPTSAEPRLSRQTSSETRPVREKKDSWKVRDMKSQGENNDRDNQDTESSQEVQSSPLSSRMMTSIAGSITSKISGKGSSSPVSPQFNPRKNHQRSHSPVKKRSKLETDK